VGPVEQILDQRDEVGPRVGSGPRTVDDLAHLAVGIDHLVDVAGAREAGGREDHVVERAAQVIRRARGELARQRDDRGVAITHADQELGLPRERDGPPAGQLELQRGQERGARRRGAPEPVAHDAADRDRAERRTPRLEHAQVDGALGLGEHADGELAAELRVGGGRVVRRFEGRRRGQVGREHVAEEVRPLRLVEVERLLAVLDDLVVGELVEVEHGLRPRLHRPLEEAAQVRGRQRAARHLRGALRRCVDDAELGSQRRL
jgi:hypothetical protein